MNQWGDGSLAYHLRLSTTDSIGSCPYYRSWGNEERSLHFGRCEEDTLAQILCEAPKLYEKSLTLKRNSVNSDETYNHKNNQENESPNNNTKDHGSVHNIRENSHANGITNEDIFGKRSKVVDSVENVIFDTPI